MEKIQLEDDEMVLIQVRKHWFLLFIQIAGICIAALLPFIFVYLMHILTSQNLLLESFAISIPFIVALYSAWLLILWMALFSIWTNYYLDVWTITNKRLIAVDQKGLFNRSTGSFRLERLQDMNVEIKGIIATLLDYGTLEAQTAGGSEEEFRASGLPHPRELKAIITGATDTLMKFERPQNIPSGT